MVVRIVCLCGALMGSALAAAPVRIGLDAEFGHRTSTADDAVRAGMEIAIAEINAAGGVLGGRKLELVTRDNRGIPARGVDNFRELAALPDLVAVFGGKFSPVLLAQLPLAHELRVPLLDPWAAADAITLHHQRPSYTFRLSLRDGWAMAYLLQQARARGYGKVGVLLPNGAWGRSNRNAVEDYAGHYSSPVIARFTTYEWSDTSLADEYLDLVQAGAEAILVVGHEPEIALLLRDVAALPAAQRRPLFSHWGAASGDLPALAGPALWDADLGIVQTYSFAGDERPVARRVAAAAMRKLGARSPAHIPAAPGVAHAYDLVHLLALALARARTTERAAIRDALEVLPAHDGLVRRYDPPFAPDRHDALGPGELFLARWQRDGSLRRLGR
jgi:branched-chain amino acid transport system substrate-binding protein